MRTIGHVRFPSFYTRLIEQRDASLKGRPVVVVGTYQQRALILAVSDEARRQGIAPRMPLQRVVSRYPDVQVMLADRQLYTHALDRIRSTLRRYTPLTEHPSFSSSYLDLSGTGRLWGRGRDVLYKIEKELATDLGLPVSGGLAVNKLVSKVAADEATRHQTDLIEVDTGDEPGFLAPQPVHILPDMPDDMLTRLRDLNLTLVSDVQSVELPYLKRVFGKPGLRAYHYAHGEDDRPVVPEQAAATLSEKIVPDEPTNNREWLFGHLFNGIHRLCLSLRSRHLATRRVRFSLQFADHQTIHRQVGFPDGCQLERPMFEKLLPLVDNLLVRRIQVGFMVVQADALTPVVEQIMLWDDRQLSREEQLFLAMDKLEQKYQKPLVSFAWTLAAGQPSVRGTA